MNELRTYLEAELPRINGYLKEQTAALPPYVREVAEHVLSAGGKRLRPLLVLLTARAFGYAGPDLYPLACSLEFLHSATLLHDDVLDGSDLRRGRSTAHTIFGRAKAILAGDALLALANRIVADYGEPRLTGCLSEAIMRTVSGEIMEIAMIRRADLSYDDYLEIITGKTAYLIQSACQCGAIAAKVPAELEDAATRFGLGLGVAFQLVDDALDYTSKAEVSGKPLGGDLREGKATLPLIFYLQETGEARKTALCEAFAKDEIDESELRRLRDEIVEAGYVKRTRAVAGEFLDKAKEALGLFPSSAEKEHLALTLASMLEREK